jgi:alpha-L-rhamnosidase
MKNLAARTSVLRSTGGTPGIIFEMKARLMGRDARSCMFAMPASLLIMAAAPTPSAGWITHPAAMGATAGKAPIALQFRRDLHLDAVPRQYPVRISADNRYVLYVNGLRVASGPSRGDLAHWRYRSIDIARLLKRGGNVIAAEVWNDGPVAPEAQISGRTGFLFEDPNQAATGFSAWRVRIDPSRTIAAGAPQIFAQVGPSYYAAGGAETIVAAQQRPDWAAARTSAADWKVAVPAITGGEMPPWKLEEDALPPMRYALASGGKVVRATGIAAGRTLDRPLTVPTRSTVSLLVDAGRVQAAYPHLVTTGGKDAQISIRYTEALYKPGGGRDKKRLPDRAEVDGGVAYGLTDSFRPDGRASAEFQPFWWRVWRFAEITVTTGDAPVTLDRFDRFETGYPFDTVGAFASSDPQLDAIWRIGWDTVKLNAHETYMDSAYWEQLQYIGDTRLSALVTYGISRDRRLPIQAIDAPPRSMQDGMVQSRWPVSHDQVIPPFALFWVGMLHDYWMHDRDTAPLVRNLPAMRGVLDWYARYIDKDGLVGTTPGWEFIDWRPGLGNYPGAPGKGTDYRCIISLQYVGALRQAGQLERALGDKLRAAADAERAQALTEAVRDKCWDARRGLFADGLDRRAFSQHANVLAVLYDIAPAERQEDILSRVTVPGGGIGAPAGITGTTFYFSFYLVRAMEHAGLGDRYLDLLKTWRGLLAQHFTTWPETPDPTRSDSHAWSAHPTADLLAIVAGVKPAKPGFATVRVEPHLGTLTMLDATVVHPAGAVHVHYCRGGGRLTAEVDMPRGVAGSFAWQGESQPLRPGRNKIDLADSNGAPSADR